MPNNERRKSPRLQHQTPVKLFFDEENPVTVQAQDFSNIGLFLIFDNEMAPIIDSIVKIQVQGIENAQIIDARVIRVVDGRGFAVEFLL
jgi:hypothetical protein